MISETFSDILMSLFYSVAFGIALGIISVFLIIIIDVAETLLRLPKFVINTDSKARIKSFLKIKIVPTGNRIKEFIQDLFFAVIFGVLFSTLSYIASDGVFRLYIFVIYILSYLLIIKTLGIFLKRIMLWLVCTLFKITVISISFIVLPIRYITSILYKNIIKEKIHSLCIKIKRKSIKKQKSIF